MNGKNINTLYLQFVEYSKNFEPETRGTYIRALRTFVNWIGERKKFEISEQEVRNYKEFLIKTKKLKPNSTSTYLAALRKFLNYLITKKVISTNPANRVKGFPRPKSHTRKYLNSSEIEKLVSSIDTSDDRGKRDYAIIGLMLKCGLSEKELVYANISDIKKENSKITLNVRGKGHSFKDEFVVIPSNIHAAIDKYLSTRKNIIPSHPLFLSAGNKVHGKRMSTRGIRERVNYYLKKSGIKKNRDRVMTPYSLRHTAASILATSGASPETIKKRMRLGTLKTAQIYIENIKK